MADTKYFDWTTASTTWVVDTKPAPANVHRTCPKCGTTWWKGEVCGYCHTALLPTEPKEPAAKAEPKKRQRFKPDVLSMIDKAMARRAK